jgi:cell shape-determining protein MreD
MCMYVSCFFHFSFFTYYVIDAMFINLIFLLLNKYCFELFNERTLGQ